MKSALPYHGVASPQARVIFREVLAAHPLPDRESWLATALAFWDEATHREEWYAALAVARHRTARAWLAPESMPLFRHLVVTGAWWDVAPSEVSEDETVQRLRTEYEAGLSKQFWLG